MLEEYALQDYFVLIILILGWFGLNAACLWIQIAAMKEIIYIDLCRYI